MDNAGVVDVTEADAITVLGHTLAVGPFLRVAAAGEWLTLAEIAGALAAAGYFPADWSPQTRIGATAVLVLHVNAAAPRPPFVQTTDRVGITRYKATWQLSAEETAAAFRQVAREGAALQRRLAALDMHTAALSESAAQQL